MSTENYQEKQQRNHIKVFKNIVDPVFLESFEKIKDSTMLSMEALYDLWQSVKYICKSHINGDIVELGVWKGGALELAGYALKEYKGSNKIIGYDTFEGHPEPNKAEFDVWGNSMHDKFNEVNNSGAKWAFADYQEVSNRLSSIYRNNRLVKGVVDGSLNTDEIKEISILRLDMDWYEPTKIALERMFDKIQKGGVLIIDDYGHHSGARKATDEFIEERNLSLNFRHINYSCIAANII